MFDGGVKPGGAVEKVVIAREKTGGAKGIGVFGGEFIAGQHFQDHAVVTHIAIEGIDDPVAPAPDMFLAVAQLISETVPIGVTPNVHPMAGPAFAVLRGGEEPVGDASEAIGTGRSEEGLQIFARGRKSGEVEVKAAELGFGRGERLGTEAGYGPGAGQEEIDGVGSGGECTWGEVGALGRSKGPVRTGVRIGLFMIRSGGSGENPEAESVLGFRGEGFALRRHAHIGVAGVDAAKDEAGLRLSGVEGGSGFTTAEKGAHGIDTEAGFLFESAVARIAALPENGFDGVEVVVLGKRRTSGERGQSEGGRKRCWEKTRHLVCLNLCGVCRAGLSGSNTQERAGNSRRKGFAAGVAAPADTPRPCPVAGREAGFSADHENFACAVLGNGRALREYCDPGFPGEGSGAADRVVRNFLTLRVMAGIVYPISRWWGSGLLMMAVWLTGPSWGQERAAGGEPEIRIPKDGIGPRAQISVVFPGPMVDPGRVGEREENRIFVFDPPWPGQVVWSDPRTAVFLPGAARAMGSEVRVGIAEGLVDGSGHAVRVPRGVRASLCGFEVVEIWRTYRRWDENVPAIGVREPVSVVSFPAAPDADSLASGLVFEDASGRRVAAQVRRARGSELSYRMSRGRTWEEEWAEVVEAGQATGEVLAGRVAEPAERDPDVELEWAWLVRPVEALPVGQDWKLRVAPGIAMAGGGSATQLERELAVGSVYPLTVERVVAVTPLDAPLYVRVAFSRGLDEEKAGQLGERWIGVEPAVSQLKLQRMEGSFLEVTGAFRMGETYRVTVHSGAPAFDGITLDESATAEIRFTPHEPVLALPSDNAFQLRSGSARYALLSANLTNIRVRIKEVDAAALPFVEQAYREYTAKLNSEENRALTYEGVAGRTRYDQVLTLEGRPDRTQRTELDWRSVFPEGLPVAIFVSVEGEGTQFAANDTRGSTVRRAAQALLQFTDLGYTWKSGGEEALFFVFSCESGEPLEGARVRLLGGEAEQLQEGVTDAAGTVRLPRAGNAAQIVLEHGADRLLAPFQFGTGRIADYRWHSWEDAKTFEPRVFLFTDRGLYRPGETVRLKGICRVREGVKIGLPDGWRVELAVSDPRGREIMRRAVNLNEFGSFEEEIAPGSGRVGSYLVNVVVAQAAEGEEADARGRVIGTFYERFEVQEFRRDAFEVEVGLAGVEEEAAVDLEVSGRYFHGAPLSDSKVTWHASFAETGFYPEGYRDYLFGDHREEDWQYWRRYYADSSESGYWRTASDSRNGDAVIDEKGSAQVRVEIPELKDFPSAVRVEASVEVTDRNQQTIAGGAETVRHPAAFYLGVERLDRLISAGDEVRLGVIAVDREGSLFGDSVLAEWRVERKVWETVKIGVAGGGAGYRNDLRLELAAEGELRVSEKGGAVEFVPGEAGEYIVTAAARDGLNREVRTAVTLQVAGGGAGAWQLADGDRLQLVPERQTWSPGETARVLLKTPVDATALVTLEQDTVVRSFVAKLRAADPVLEVPLGELEGPNVFVGVTAIAAGRGEDGRLINPRVRTGHARLLLAQSGDRLELEVESDAERYLPGAAVSVLAEVRDGWGRPAADCEVTLYAVDEGVLSVAGYRLPDPIAYFHTPMGHKLRSGESAEQFLTENGAEFSFGNKGYLVGGAGENLSGNQGRLRSDFRALAFWSGGLRTDAEGRVRASFTAPESLTRFRVMAVAIDGSRRFGSGESSFEVNKPLMLEPVIPRFGHVGDRVVVKGLAFNRTAVGGDFRVELALDEAAGFDDGSPVEGEAVESGGVQGVELRLEAGASAAVAFGVRFLSEGETVWNWNLRPVTLDAPLPEFEREAGQDAVESRLRAVHPVPVLREAVFGRVEPGTLSEDFLLGSKGVLFPGTGQVLVSVSRTRLSDAVEAVDRMLTYPYGCVEQTSSSLMPWLMLYRVPELRGLLARPDEEVQGALRSGLDRLLAMQTGEGGLSYWPGAQEPTLWGSAYGGLVLALAQEIGYDLPQARLDALWEYLSQSLRDTGPDAGRVELSHRALAVFALAKANRAEPAYHEKLFELRAGLALEARALAAAAVAASGGPEELVEGFLAEAEVEKPGPEYSYGRSHVVAVRLLAWLEYDPRNPAAIELAEQLMTQRNARGDWGSTYGNAWALLALSAEAKAEGGGGEEPSRILVRFGDREEQVRLDREQPAHRLVFDVKLADGAPSVRLAAEGEGMVYVAIQAAARPERMPPRRPDQGFLVTRRYLRMNAEGQAVPAEKLRIGDLVLIQLDVTAEQAASYVVVDDPLPALLEPVQGKTADRLGRRDSTLWRTDYREMRDDRAVFFCDALHSAGRFQLEYYARVTGEGDVFAPPATVEAMYDPALRGFSGSGRLGVDGLD